MTKPATASDDDRMDRLVAGFSKKSEKIRALDAAGYSRRRIAEHLDIIPQHVWNVLGPVRKTAPGPARVIIGPGGRIVIPAPYRKTLGIKEGDEVILRLEDGEVRIVSRAQALRHAQELVAKYVPPGVSLVDELIAERRREVASEKNGE